MAYNTQTGSQEIGDLKYEDDSDTQIDWASDKISFLTDNTVRLVIDNSGVSIPSGMSFSGASANLVTSGYLKVSGSSTLGTDSADIINVVGLLGIGTTSPNRMLEVENGDNLPQLRITHTDETHFTDFSTTSNGRLRIRPSSRTVEVDTGDTNGGNILFTKNGGTTSGGISWDTGDQDVTLYSEADLYLGAGGSSQKVIVDNGGNVGIGVTDPDHKLEVSGNLHLGAERSAAPSAPSAGDGGILYTKVDGKIYWISDDLSETDLTAGSSGISFNGSTANGVVTYGGATTADVESNLTFNGSILSVTGEITASAGLSVNADDRLISVGASEDLSLYHDGDSTIQNKTGHLQLYNTATDKHISLRLGEDNTDTAVQVKNNSNSTVWYCDAAGNVSGSGELEVVGAAKFSNTISVTGAINAKSDLSFSAGGSIVGGSTIAITVDSSGHVTKIGQDAPSSGQFLKWDGSKAVWDAASGGGGISWDGSTANGIATFKDSDEATVEANLTFDGSDLKLLEAVNDGNPSLSIGGADAEKLLVQSVFDSGAQTLDYVKFSTAVASATANKGKYIFDVDGTDIVTIDDGGIDLASGKTFAINGTDIVSSPITALNNATANELVVVGSTTTELDAKSELTFNGTTLAVQGNISGSGTLEMMGAGTISGSFRAKQLHITHHAYNYTGVEQRWIPFYNATPGIGREGGGGSPNLGSSKYQIIVPFNGRLARVYFRCFEGTSANVNLSLITASSGIAEIDDLTGPRSAENGTVAIPAQQSQLVLWNLTGSQHFQAGEIVGITVDPQSSDHLGDVNLTCVWEYNMFNI